MGIEIKWSEDGKFGTISKEDITKLQGNFDKGFGAGKESGKKEIMKLFSFLELDEDNFAEGINKIKQKLTDIQNGKLPEDMMKKIKDLDLVKELQEKLDKKTQAYEKLESDFSGYKKSMLIDNKLAELAQGKKAVNAKEAALLFKNSYSIDLGEDDKIILKNTNGNAIFDSEGNELGLEKVFENFAREKSYLFEANSSGGSGGGGGEPGNPRKIANMKDEDFNQLVNDVKMGKSVEIGE